MAGGRRIVITGASKGIGAKTAALLLASGYSIVATARGESALRDLYGNEKNAEAIPWDLSDPARIGDYAKTVKEAVGPVAGLIHCAGIEKTFPIHITKPAKIEEVFNINTYAAMLLVSGFSKKGMTEDTASFVLISSLAAHEGVRGHAVYAASKAALEGFARAAAPELAEKGIRINCIAPGTVETEMTAAYRSQLTESQDRAFSAGYPLGIGTAHDIAAFAKYLVSEEAKWLTGQTYILDGGHLARGAEAGPE
jgi:NAD(P)-dependent dehydrogenase (short-subunit alcohol dehydrogenase family)